VKFAHDVYYYRNIVATPKAMKLFDLEKFAAFDPEAAAPPVIIWVTWHPWWITFGDGSAPRVTKGPFYNISSSNFERVAKLPSPRFFIIADRIVAISLAPYLNFDEKVTYEMDDVNGLVIYEKHFLELVSSSRKI
jgi:hypothetical protein